MLESGSTPREYCLTFLDRLLIVLDNISFEDIFLLTVCLHNIFLQLRKILYRPALLPGERSPQPIAHRGVIVFHGICAYQEKIKISNTVNLKTLEAKYWSAFRRECSIGTGGED